MKAKAFKILDLPCVIYDTSNGALPWGIHVNPDSTDVKPGVDMPLVYSEIALTINNALAPKFPHTLAHVGTDGKVKCHKGSKMSLVYSDVWTEDELTRLNLFDDNFKNDAKKRFPLPTISNPPQPTSTHFPAAKPTTTSTNSSPARHNPRHTKLKTFHAQSNPYTTTTPPRPSNLANFDPEVVQFAMVSTMRHMMHKEQAIKQAQVKRAADKAKDDLKKKIAADEARKMKKASRKIQKLEEAHAAAAASSSTMVVDG
ncbi:hypothetical protein Moror_13010 [Moniliophthora roreri MCA 2997]|uniref:Uncharacterized protein n=1 Tax=Moniliophthora roreri (strain MCA 2997) TaxID=1381753 RepID=V2X437_MONRO|nr:hypothetical protein Moror_13010 [Moniliophthora roreri MCA 2997]